MTIKLSDFTGSPSTSVFAASDWQAYTATISNLGGTAVVSVQNFKWRRDGGDMLISGGFSLQSATAGAGSGFVQVSLPPTYSIDLSALPSTSGYNNGRNALGTAQLYTNTFLGGSLVLPFSATTVSFIRTGSGTQVQGADFVVGSEMEFYCRVPILGWTSATQSNDAVTTEYAYNTNVTATASDTTSFATGSSGIPFPATWVVGTQYQRRVRFSTPVTVDDLVQIEILDGLIWQPIADRIGSFVQMGTNAYGARFAAVAGSNTDIEVSFSQGGFRADSTYGANGGAWSVLTAFSWRVRKTKATVLALSSPAATTAAAVGNWVQAPVPSTGWFIAGQGPTNVNVSVWMKQVSDSLDLRYDFSSTGTSAAFTNFAVYLPAGFTMDTSKLNLVSTNGGEYQLFVGDYLKPGVTRVPVYGIATPSAGANFFTVQYINVAGATAGNAGQTITNSAPAGWDLTSNPTNMTINTVQPIPMVQLAGAGVVSLAPGAAVEYYSATLASDADYAGAISTSPDGSSVPTVTLTAERTITMSLSTPLLNDEALLLEIDRNNDGNWMPYTANSATGSFMYLRQLSTTYGMYLSRNGASGVRVTFCANANTSTGVYGAAGIAWTAFLPMRWRLKRYKVTIPAGIGPASAVTSGLMTTGIQTIAGDKTFLGNVAAANVLSGRYAPTITAIANSAIGTVFAAHYMRVGNIVTVSGFCGVSTGATAATNCTIRVSVPVSSAMNNAGDAAGTCCWGNTPGGTDSYSNGYGVWITGNTIDFFFQNTKVSSAANFTYSFQYEIK